MQLTARASEWIDSHRDALCDFLVRLIGARSDPGHEVIAQEGILFPFLKEGMNWSSLELVNVCRRSRRPFINGVWRGEGGGPPLLLNGHVDVAPVPNTTREQWPCDPWCAELRKGNVYGRGAVDMKGGIAAMLWGIQALMEQGIRLGGDLLISLVCGEETGEAAIGSAAAAQRFQQAGWEIPFAVIAEPSGLEIHTTSVGQLDFSISVTGKEIHTCARSQALFPQPLGTPQGCEVGVDAISKMARLVLLLEDLERQWAVRRPNGESGDGSSRSTSRSNACPLTINPTFVEGGSHEGMLPGHVRLDGIISYPGWVQTSLLKAEFAERLRSFCQLDDWLSTHPADVCLGLRYDWPPHWLNPAAPGPQALGHSLQHVLGRSPVFSTGKFVGDAAFLQRDCGIDAVYFGPGTPSMGAHGPDEHIPLDEVIQAAKVFASFIIAWCGLG